MYTVAKVDAVCVRHTMTVNTAVDRPREKDGDDTGKESIGRGNRFCDRDLLLKFILSPPPPSLNPTLCVCVCVCVCVYVCVMGFRVSAL